MSDLSEAMVTAGTDAYDAIRADSGRTDIRAAIAAALRVLAPRQVPGWDGADLIELADAVEHPAEDGT